MDVEKLDMINLKKILIAKIALKFVAMLKLKIKMQRKVFVPLLLK
jgi:hypothetical protein